MDEDGNYSGYTYEYLMRVAQLTGWKYEFFPVELSNENLVAGLEQVREGELHLAGTMNYSETLAEQYEYSIPYGQTSFALVALEENAQLNDRTLIKYPNLRVALTESATGQNALFDQYCQENGIQYQPVYAKTNAECRNMMETGLVDACISKDISPNSGLKIVAKFAPRPFYFASKKGNEALIAQLNDALRAINTADPAFQTAMHEKYFPAYTGLHLPLTEAEREYLKSEPTVRVAVLGGREPIQGYDAKTEKFSGILIDLMELIFQRSGLRYEFIYLENEQLLRQKVNEGCYDIVAGIPYFYGHNAASGTVSRFLLTPPIFSSPVVRISNLQGNARHKESLVAESIKNMRLSQGAIYYSDDEEMFRLVNNGEYGEAYINGYMAQYCIKTGNYPNVSLSFIPNGNYGLCLGVSRNCDLRLVSILTQAIATLSDAEVEDIVYQNTNQPVDNSLWNMVRRNPTQVVVPVLMVLMLVLGLLTLLMIKTKRLNKLIAQEKNTYKAIAQFDRLSRTYNNIEFKQLATSFLAQVDEGFSGALIVCDIDNFKKINDTFGHLKGDEVIQELGHLMTSIFCNHDIVGRLGGDEFVVMLHQAPNLAAVEKVCQELKEKSQEMVPDCAITLSIGVAIFHGRTDFEGLFKRADAALYDVKNSGKNAFKICTT